MNDHAKYYKHAAESILGEGVALLETLENVVTRQVEIYGSSMIWCDRTGQSDDRFMIADQPFLNLGLTPEIAVGP
jgi:hypothetical protein